MKDHEKEDLKNAAVAVGFMATGLALLAAVWGFFAQIGGHLADLIEDER